MELFNRFFDPGGSWEVISRGGHVLAGITWIGLLYFFNFVQVPAFAELSDGARSEALRKLTFRALWWFRMGALLTLLFGLSIITVQDEMDAYFEGAHGTAILTGMLFAVTMFANVWFVIWPNQKVVIGSAERVAAGGEADPNAAGAAKAAARASRANTFMSVTMLWFMVFAAHGGGFWDEPIGTTIIYWLVILATWAYIELSALGRIGGYDSPYNKLVFDDHRRTILASFLLLAAVWIVGWEILLKASAS